MLSLCDAPGLGSLRASELTARVGDLKRTFFGGVVVGFDVLVVGSGGFLFFIVGRESVVKTEIIIYVI